VAYANFCRLPLSKSAWALRAGTFSPTCRRLALMSGKAAQFEPV